MALVSLEDPGLTVFGYHRLLPDLGERRAQEALREALLANFEVTEVELDDLDPAGEQGVGVFGYIDSHHRKGYRLRLKDPAPLEAAMPDASDAFRELDAAILEALVLRGALGMSADGHRGQARDRLHRLGREALRLLDGDTDAAFLMRPTPVSRCATSPTPGETMPPKSTYFFPKLLTGIVFNPLS